MKKTVTFIAVLCFFMAASAQQVNHYTHKLDSVCYGGSAKEVFLYDDRLNCTEITTIVTDGSNDVYAQKTFVYDSNNHVVKSDYVCVFDDIRETHEYSYNKDGLLTEDLFTRYYLVLGCEELFKYTYEYDENNRRTVARGFDYYDGIWKESYHTFYEYENDLLVLSLYYLGSSLYRTISYTYNEQGLRIEEVVTVSDVEIQKTIYGYDEWGNLTSKTILGFDQEQQIWITSSRAEYIYDENGDCISVKYANSQYYFSYDPFVPVAEIAGLMSFWNFSFTPKNLVLSYYWYDDYFGSNSDPVSFHYSSLNGLEETMGTEGFCVYPNPVTNGILMVSIPHSEFRIPNYTIANLMGQPLLSGTISDDGRRHDMTFLQIIDVSSLSPGVYFITLGDSTQKFIVR